MAAIVPQSGSGNPLVYAAATAGGDTVTFGSSGHPIVVVRNASAAPVTVTLQGIVPCSQGFTHNVVYNCAVGDTEIEPPANTLDTAAATRGNVNLTYSAVASVTVAAVAS